LLVALLCAGLAAAAFAGPGGAVRSATGRAAIAGLAILLLAPLAAASWSWLGGRLERIGGRLLLTATAAATLASVGLAAWYGRSFLAALPARLSVAAAAPVLAVGLWYALRRLGPSRSAGALAALATAGLSATAVVSTQREPAVAARMVAESLLAGPPIAALRLLRDGDRDGYSSWLGGGDCDDSDPATHPGAPDLPGDGIDADCSGADAVSGPLLVERRAVEPTPWPPDAPPRPDSVVLITIDALRADMLAPTSGSGPMSHLQRFAAAALRAERAYAPSSATEETLPAMLAHGVLPRTLADAGRTTAAWVNGWTKAHVSRLGGWFDTFEAHLDAPTEAQRRAMAPHTTARALEFLAGRKTPFFLWLHYIDPHAPYTPPDGPKGGADRDRYRAELTWLDGHLARLLDHVTAPPLGQRTVVVVTADHGEEFGEHGGRYHARELYEESVRVPLLVRGPGVPPGLLHGTASLLDVAPTLLDLLGVAPPPGQRFGGRSLLPPARAAEPIPRRPLVLNVHPRAGGRRRGVVWWPFKLLERTPEGERLLFHLERDPAERSDVTGTYPGVADSLRATLAAARE